MASAGSDGVLYVSFGSYKQFNQDIMDRVGGAIAALPYKVIWKCNMKVNVELDAKRVMVVEWAPQNDILAHPATRVFLTHGGTTRASIGTDRTQSKTRRYKQLSRNSVPRGSGGRHSSLCGAGVTAVYDTSMCSHFNDVLLQFDTVHRLASRGFGVALDRDTFTSEQLAREIIHVFNDSGLVI